MRYIGIFLALFSLCFPKVFIESNYPLRNNNFQKVASEENLFLILWALQSIKDVRDIKIMTVGGDTVIYVERYPILKEVEVEGNWFVDDTEIKNLLLIHEGEPLVDFDPDEARRTLEFYYRRRGFLDAKADIKLSVDDRGFAEVRVKVREGDVYFLGGGIFKGAKSYPTWRLIHEAGLMLGEVYSEEKAKRGRWKLEDFYRSRGFLEVGVYFEGTKKLKAKKPFAYVLFPGIEGTERNFGKGVTSLLRGVSNFLDHPMATIKALFGRGSLAVPVYTVSEGRRFRIEFEGNESFSEEELLKLIDLSAPGVDIFLLENSRESIEEFYRSKGFFDVKVKYSYREGRITFHVEEGQRYRLKVLGFKDFHPSEYYDREEIEKERERILEEERSRGYLTAQLRLWENVDRERKTVYVVAELERGKRPILKDVVYKGEDREFIDLFWKYRASLPTILKGDLLEDLNRSIKKLLRNRGYLDGDFAVDIKIAEDKENLYLTYVYRIEKGERYRYGRLLIYGNERTRAREIDYTLVKERYYSEDAEEESLWNMVQSENYTGVKIEHFIDRDRKEVHRLVEVREDKRGVLELAAGYNTEEKIKVEGGVKLKNLFGVGIILEGRASKSQKYETYRVGLSDRYLFSRKYFADIAVFRSLEFHNSFDLQSEGFSFSFGYRPKRWYSVSPFISKTRNKVSGTGAGTYDLLKYGIFLLRETRDDLVNPRSLSHNSLRISKVEGERSYYRIEVNNFFLRELTHRFSFDVKLSGGWVGKEAPIFDRFFLGGLRDMRGYDFESIGYPYGGRMYVFGRFELLFSVREPFWLGIYTDAGNVGNSFSKTVGELKYDIGVAAGIRTPAGFVRLDLAKPMSDIDRPTSKFRIYLSVGFVY